MMTTRSGSCPSDEVASAAVSLRLHNSAPIDTATEDVMANEAARPLAEARTVEAGHGLAWWTGAWTLFMKNAGMWIVFGVVLFVIFAVLGFIPFLGVLATSLLLPVFMGSWVLAARKVESGVTLECADLFAGFKDKLTPLLVIVVLL